MELKNKIGAKFMRFEPLFMEPEFKDYIWGGKRLKEVFNKNVKNIECTAESWEISTNDAGISKIRNGEFKGENLKDLFNNQEVKENIFGKKCMNLSEFPLLIKFIDANKNLSVQVHPNDDYARKYENSQGKNEMWYILDCSENAQIIYGVKTGTTKEALKEKIENNRIKDILNYVDVKKGDVIYIPSGTLHSILGNTLIVEIQQNSNLTYRVYDWDRVGSGGKPRELHTKKALDVIDIKRTPQINNFGEIEGITTIIDSDCFKVDKINVKDEIKVSDGKSSFKAFCVVQGNGKLKLENEIYNLTKGDSFILPACIENYTIVGNIELLKSYL